jgi:hypothetical protein
MQRNNIIKSAIFQLPEQKFPATIEGKSSRKFEMGENMSSPKSHTFLYIACATIGALAIGGMLAVLLHGLMSNPLALIDSHAAAAAETQPSELLAGLTFDGLDYHIESCPWDAEQFANEVRSILVANGLREETGAGKLWMYGNCYFLEPELEQGIIEIAAGIDESEVVAKVGRQIIYEMHPIGVAMIVSRVLASELAKHK